VFPYVGGKTNIAPWIIDFLPDHEVYVEPFGGSAAILLNKPRSRIEIYNDLDGDVTQFFDVVRERPDELKDWVRRTPFSEELHDRWTQQFYSGERADDPVARAGRFLFLRYSAFGAKYAGPSGFSRDTLRTRAGESQTWARVPEKIEETCRRFQGVSIQNADYRGVIDRYDSEETLFLCDPPYLNKEDLYRVDGFEHADLADALADLEGDAMVCYTDRPEGLYDGWHVEERASQHNAGARDDESVKNVTERLLMNFEPSDRDPFLGPQATLAMADGHGDRVDREGSR
jgi:DNA adenine methylase